MADHTYSKYMCDDGLFAAVYTALKKAAREVETEETKSYHTGNTHLEEMDSGTQRHAAWVSLCLDIGTEEQPSWHWMNDFLEEFLSQAGKDVDEFIDKNLDLDTLPSEAIEEWLFYKREEWKEAYRDSLAWSDIKDTFRWEIDDHVAEALREEWDVDMILEQRPDITEDLLPKCPACGGDGELDWQHHKGIFECDRCRAEYRLESTKFLSV